MRAKCCSKDDFSGSKDDFSGTKICSCLTPSTKASLVTQIEHKMSSLCYSSLSGTGPQYLSDLIQMYTSSRCLHSSSDTRILRIPTVKTKCYGQRFFAYQGPTIWNKLPLEIRHQSTIDGLIRALKTHLFRFQ